MRRSNRPGRRIAGSRISLRLVQPITLTLDNGLNPSISAKNCINVRCTSRSPLVPNSILLAARESSSSIKIIEGAFSLASSKISLTNLAPSPINFCTSSEPTISINVELVEAATALANKVLPVPGGPYNKIPFGGSMPTFLNNSGFFKGSSTTSRISCTSCFNPPTSDHLILGFSIITNCSTLNLLVVGTLSTIVKFFCSTRTASPTLRSVTELALLT